MISNTFFTVQLPSILNSLEDILLPAMPTELGTIFLRLVLARY